MPLRSKGRAPQRSVHKSRSTGQSSWACAGLLSVPPLAPRNPSRPPAPLFPSFAAHASATSAPGLDSSLPHLHRDCPLSMGPPPSLALPATAGRAAAAGQRARVCVDRPGLPRLDAHVAAGAAPNELATARARCSERTGGCSPHLGFARTQRAPTRSHAHVAAPQLSWFVCAPCSGSRR
jgi:hypothetical protein